MPTPARVLVNHALRDAQNVGVPTKLDPLFTLGSVYSPKASGAEQTTETNNSNLTLKQIIQI